MIEVTSSDEISIGLYCLLIDAVVVQLMQCRKGALLTTASEFVDNIDSASQSKTWSSSLLIK